MKTISSDPVVSEHYPLSKTTLSPKNPVCAREVQYASMHFFLNFCFDPN